jgi:hypothetical protein
MMERDAGAEVYAMLREGWQVSWTHGWKGPPCPICSTWETERRPQFEFEEETLDGLNECKSGHYFLSRSVRFTRPYSP